MHSLTVADTIQKNVNILHDYVEESAELPH